MATIPLNPWIGIDPEKELAWESLTDEQKIWIGGADPTDPIILSRGPAVNTPVEKVNEGSLDESAQNKAALILLTKPKLLLQQHVRDCR